MTLDILKLLIPIVAITMGCSIPLLAIFLEHRKRQELLTLCHQERMAAIEKGIELPPMPEGFFQEEGRQEKTKSPHRDFGWGLFWSLGGLALLVALYFNEKGSSALYALIPIAIGLHYLIYYYLIGRKEAEAIETERKTQASEFSRGSMP
jgi:hypothetical protein